MKEMTNIDEIRHSTAHVLATAVLRIFPEAQLDIGPPTDSGFYYDFDLDHKFSTEDLEKIEGVMKQIIKENQAFKRIEVTREEAKEYFTNINQPYKLSRLNDIPEDQPVTYYQNGEFIDLCAGSHVRYTKKIKAFKLLSIAGAYHRGDEKNKQLQRIYGTAFTSKVELDEYLERIEESKKRDHRKIGKDLRLFHIDDQVGQGLVLWTPKGSIIRQELQHFIGKHLTAQGYEQVFTPHIGKLGLYRTSGHFPYYQDSQYSPILEGDQLNDLADQGCSCSDLSKKLNDGDLDGYLLRPMNCPMHISIFKSKPHSYRDLPVRLAEFGTVYRWEKSGELNGMTRVRGFTQDDAHLFCTEEQLAEEITGCLDLVKNVFSTLGMDDYRVRIGLRDPDSTKYTGESELWNKAENALREAVKTLDVEYKEEPGEAAFYGPKIDFVVRDVIGREWQLGTVQVDYNLPIRFDLSYTGSDNKPHRPVMIHRAPFGSMERFVGLLIEHFSGNFPTWLAPEQVRVLPMNPSLNEYANQVLKKLRAHGIRAKIDTSGDKLGAMIRNAELEKTPHMLVIGKKEAEGKLVSARSRLSNEFQGSMDVDRAIEILNLEIQSRSLPNKH